MNPPSNVALVFASALFWWPGHVLAADTPPDPLWRKAVAVAAANADWVPGLVIVRSQVLHKGETNGVHEMWTRSSAGTNGAVVTQLLKVLEDGKDITEQEKKAAKNEKKKPERPGGSNPFEAEAQERLSLKVVQKSRIIAGHSCIGYAFEVRSPKRPVTRGVAWLDEATGIPAEVENMTVDPLPDKHLKRLAMTTRYESTADGGWYAREIKTTGSASMLFVTVEIQSLTILTEYWKNSRDNWAMQRSER